MIPLTWDIEYTYIEYRKPQRHRMATARGWGWGNGSVINESGFLKVDFINGRI